MKAFERIGVKRRGSKVNWTPGYSNQQRSACIPRKGEKGMTIIGLRWLWHISPRNPAATVRVTALQGRADRPLPFHSPSRYIATEVCRFQPPATPAHLQLGTRLRISPSFSFRRNIIRVSLCPLNPIHRAYLETHVIPDLLANGLGCVCKIGLMEASGSRRNN